MSVAELLKKQEINIKELATTFKKPDLSFFDPERDISEKQWKKIIEEIDSYPNNEARDVFEYVYQLSNLKIISPERFDNYIKELRYWGKFAVVWKLFDAHKLHRGGYYELNTVANSLITFPKERARILSSTSTSFLKSLVNLESSRAFSDWEKYGMAAKVIETDNLSVPPLFFDSFKGQIRSVNPNSIADIAVVTRILYPERFSELGLDENDFRRMFSRIPPYCLDDLNEVRNLMILSADEIKIDEKGLHLLLNRNKPQIFDSPLPIERNF